MPNRRFNVLPLLLLCGLVGVEQPVQAQALLPHVLQIDVDKLQKQGLGLAQEAAQLAQFQQYEPALARAQLATQLVPKSPEVWSLLGGLYLQVNQLDPAIVALKQAQTLDPKNSAVLFALGSASFQKQDYAGSVNYLQAGLKIKPNVPGALFDLGNAYLMLKQSNEAIASFEKAVAQDKTFWPAINNIGLIHYEQGDVEAALKRWKQALEIDAKAAEPQLAVAAAVYKQGDRERGLALGEQAIKLDSRYADLKFLKENLWGDRLLKDAQSLLETPRLRAALVQVQSQQDQFSPRSTQ